MTSKRTPCAILARMVSDYDPFEPPCALDDLGAICRAMFPHRNTWSTWRIADEPDAVRCNDGWPTVTLTFERTDEPSDRVTQATVVLAGAGDRPPTPSPARLREFLQGFIDFTDLIEGHDRARFARLSPALWVPTKLLDRRKAKSAEDFTALFAKHHKLTAETDGAWLSCSALEAMVRPMMPCREGAFEISLVKENAVQEHEGSLSLTIWLIVYDKHETTDEWQIRNLKEQSVYAVPETARRDPERVRAYLEGTLDGFRAFAQQRAHTDELDCSMPCDLIDPGLLKLTRPQTREDFFRAYCRRRKLTVD
ncbi:MAG: hypothetical protein Q8Q09_05800 [Deltaproteobacteria bacterium]|nr:hypothetical protein [Deltaproteobacteria bacterium]